MANTEKTFLSISETAEIIGVPQHVLRFWETKFKQISPLKRKGNRRFYRQVDIQLLKKIKKLLYEDGFTIKGADKILKSGATPISASAVEKSKPSNKTKKIKKQQNLDQLGFFNLNDEIIDPHFESDSHQISKSDMTASHNKHSQQAVNEFMPPLFEELREKPINVQNIDLVEINDKHDENVDINSWEKGNDKKKMSAPMNTINQVEMFPELKSQRDLSVNPTNQNFDGILSRHYDSNLNADENFKDELSSEIETTKPTNIKTKENATLKTQSDKGLLQNNDEGSDNNIYMFEMKSDEVYANEVNTKEQIANHTQHNEANNEKLQKIKSLSTIKDDLTKVKSALLALKK